MQRLATPLALLLAALTYLPLSAQIGGGDTYQFLLLPPSPRVTALGGTAIAIQDDDLSLAYQNPAALSSSIDNHLAFNIGFLPGGISNSYAAYGRHVDAWNTTFHISNQNIGYGDFDATDEFGNINGTFSAQENALTIGAARQYSERLTFGANVRLVSSRLESYQSVGIATDLAAMYRDTASRFTATLVVQQLGAQLTTYQEERESLPLEIQFGISKRLKYLPFRFGITAIKLQQWNLIYDDPNLADTEGSIFDTPTEDSDLELFVGNVFRHLVFNGEFLFGARENFRLRFGYNHLRRRDLSVDRLRSLAGFSFGAGFKINRFRVSYGYSSYHLAGGLHHLGIGLNIEDFYRKG